LIKIEKETKLYISLMLEDEKVSKVSYTKCNFRVIKNRTKKHRIWERPCDKDVVCEAHNKKPVEEI